MTSKNFYRELGSPHERAAPLDWWWGLVALLVMAALLWLTAQLDVRNQRLLAAQAAEHSTHQAQLQSTSVACEVRP